MILKFEDICIDKEFEDLLPVLTTDEYENLEKNIVKNGLLDPIKVWQDPETDDNSWFIIDGHNRYHIMKNNNIDFDIWNGFKIMNEAELPTRESVKEWMLEQQLGRRNLSEMDRYEIAQKFKDIIVGKAKKNQSLGGKGSSNLSKVNTRKELADKVGVSEGTYRKLDKIAHSGNEDVKRQLNDKSKKVSVDKAYKMVQEPKQEKSTTPMQRIEKVDSRIDEIEREISSLHTEKQALIRKRATIFDALDIKCELKYEFTNDDLISRECSFYIEVDGHKKVFVTCGVFNNEELFSLYTSKIPDKYKNDFTMLYRKAHFEDIEFFNVRWSQFEKKQKERQVIGADANIDKDFQKKCFRILAKSFHPDNGEEGNIDDMKSLNQLKQVWGV